MKITIFLVVIVTCINISDQFTLPSYFNFNNNVPTTVKPKEKPTDDLVFIVNAFLRGDFIALLTKIVEIVQKQDTALVVKVILILLHRFLTLIQPIFYKLFPSTKDQGSVKDNLLTRIKTTASLVSMFLGS